MFFTATQTLVRSLTCSIVQTPLVNVFVNVSVPCRDEETICNCALAVKPIRAANTTVSANLMLPNVLTKYGTNGRGFHQTKAVSSLWKSCCWRNELLAMGS